MSRRLGYPQPQSVYHDLAPGGGGSWQCTDPLDYTERAQLWDRCIMDETVLVVAWRGGTDGTDGKEYGKTTIKLLR